MTLYTVLLVGVFFSCESIDRSPYFFGGFFFCSGVGALLEDSDAEVLLLSSSLELSLASSSSWDEYVTVSFLSLPLPFGLLSAFPLDTAVLLGAILLLAASLQGLLERRHQFQQIDRVGHKRSVLFSLASIMSFFFLWVLTLSSTDHQSPNFQRNLNMNSSSITKKTDWSNANAKD